MKSSYELIPYLLVLASLDINVLSFWGCSLFYLFFVSRFGQRSSTRSLFLCLRGLGGGCLYYLEPTSNNKEKRVGDVASTLSHEINLLQVRSTETPGIAIQYWGRKAKFMNRLSLVIFLVFFLSVFLSFLLSLPLSQSLFLLCHLTSIITPFYRQPLWRCTSWFAAQIGTEFAACCFQTDAKTHPTWPWQMGSRRSCCTSSGIWQSINFILKATLNRNS